MFIKLFYSSMLHLFTGVVAKQSGCVEAGGQTVVIPESSDGINVLAV